MPRYAERTSDEAEYFSVDYSKASVVSELRRLDLDVDEGDLSDIWLASIDDLILTEELASSGNASLMSVQMRRGARFPPVVVRATSGGLLVVDGHHRIDASRLVGYGMVPVRELLT